MPGSQQGAPVKSSSMRDGRGRLSNFRNPKEIKCLAAFLSGSNLVRSATKSGLEGDYARAFQLLILGAIIQESIS